MKYAGKALCFDDILLKPGISDVTSRGNVDLTMSHKDFSLSLPVFSAPMDSVTGFDMVLAMNEAGGMGVLPRNGIDQSQVFLQLTTGLDFHDFFYSISSSMGIREFDEMNWLQEREHRLICVEVAHGGNIQAVRKVEALRDMFPEALIMSGNVATFDEFIKLSDAGASFIRVGIGGGSACTTRIETGHGVPTLQSIIDIDKMRHENDAAIIADGGLRSSGDAAKAFAAGAKFVMLGGMLARTNSAPEIRDSNNNLVFRGMASSVFTDRVEGVSHALDRNGVSSVDVLSGFGNGLRSACSYGGVHELSSLCGESEYVVVSSSSVRESGAHFND